MKKLTLAFGNNEREHQSEVHRFHCGCTHCSREFGRLHAREKAAAARVRSRDAGSPLTEQMAASASIHVSSNWNAFERELQKLLLLQTKYVKQRSWSNTKKVDIHSCVGLNTHAWRMLLDRRLRIDKLMQPTKIGPFLLPLGMARS